CPSGSSWWPPATRTPWCCGPPMRCTRRGWPPRSGPAGRREERSGPAEAERLPRRAGAPQVVAGLGQLRQPLHHLPPDNPRYPAHVAVEQQVVPLVEECQVHHRRPRPDLPVVAVGPGAQLGTREGEITELSRDRGDCRV